MAQKSKGAPAPSAVIYARISQDRTGAGLGTARQIEDCKELAAQLGLSVTEVFTDNDVSASSYGRKPRPGYQAMLGRLPAVDAVLIWHADRLHRQPIELEEYVRLVQQHGVATHAVRGGEIDLASHEGILQAGILGQLARYESGHKSDRIKRKHEQSARAGLWRGGARPFGYSIDGGELVLNEDESRLIRDASRAVLAGRSLGSIITEWNAAGVQTTGKGKGWTYATLRQALMRPRNAGLSVYRGEVVGMLQSPPIVSEDVWRAVCSLLTDPSRRRSQTNKAVHLLAGIAQCHCGEPVRSATIKGRDGVPHKVYRCPAKGKGHVGKRISSVDAVVNELMVILQTANAANTGRQEQEQSATADEVAGLQAELAAKRQRLDDAAGFFAAGDIDGRQLSTITERVKRESAAIEARLTELQIVANRPHLPAVTPADIMDTAHAAVWSDSSVDARRDFVRSVCGVVLLPHSRGSARVFDPGTVLVVLKSKPGLLTVEEIQHAIKSSEEAEAGNGERRYRMVVMPD